ncbi:unnamed protein product [Prorocentrum cordatum]|uniref:Uncharacterized protein n=1 Tax=Prorocentrum cordatum TaxID=2364126 RepID=A0ABN9V407_9DINO|nr:unnamed protein product [Polarella glacialis]
MAAVAIVVMLMAAAPTKMLRVAWYRDPQSVPDEFGNAAAQGWAQLAPDMADARVGGWLVDPTLALLPKPAIPLSMCDELLGFATALPMEFAGETSAITPRPASATIPVAGRLRDPEEPDALVGDKRRGPKTPAQADVNLSAFIESCWPQGGSLSESGACDFAVARGRVADRVLAEAGGASADFKSRGAMEQALPRGRGASARAAGPRARGAAAETAAEQGEWRASCAGNGGEARSVLAAALVLLLPASLLVQAAGLSFAAGLGPRRGAAAAGARLRGGPGVSRRDSPIDMSDPIFLPTVLSSLAGIAFGAGMAALTDQSAKFSQERGAVPERLATQLSADAGMEDVESDDTDKKKDLVNKMRQAQGLEVVEVKKKETVDDGW